MSVFLFKLGHSYLHSRAKKKKFHQVALYILQDEDFEDKNTVKHRLKIDPDISHCLTSGETLDSRSSERNTECVCNIFTFHFFSSESMCVQLMSCH